MNTVPNLTTKSLTQQIALASIRTDDGSQGRVKIREAVVRDYAAAMNEQLAEGGLQFPAIVLFWDGQDYWIGDGFHRILAACKAGLTDFLAEVRPGTQRDALLHAISANTEHGLQRTRADKRKAVSLLLGDPEWSQWSDREIARRCHVDNTLVSKMRRGASVVKPQMRKRRVRRGDTIYEMEAPCTPGLVSETPGDKKSTTAQPLTTLAATDPLGIPLAEPMTAVFASLAEFQEAQSLATQLADRSDRIARGPGGEMLRQHLQRKTERGTETFASAEVESLLQKLLSTEPYCSCCPYCYLAHTGWYHPDCKACRGLGWITRSAFESCPESYRQDMLRSVCPPATKAG